MVPRLSFRDNPSIWTTGTQTITSGQPVHLDNWYPDYHFWTTRPSGQLVPRLSLLDNPSIWTTGTQTVTSGQPVHLDNWYPDYHFGTTRPSGQLVPRLSLRDNPSTWTTGTQTITLGQPVHLDNWYPDYHFWTTRPSGQLVLGKFAHILISRLQTCMSGQLVPKQEDNLDNSSPIAGMSSVVAIWFQRWAVNISLLFDFNT